MYKRTWEYILSHRHWSSSQAGDGNAGIVQADMMVSVHKGKLCNTCTLYLGFNSFGVIRQLDGLGLS